MIDLRKVQRKGKVYSPPPPLLNDLVSIRKYYGNSGPSEKSVSPTHAVSSVPESVLPVRPVCASPSSCVVPRISGPIKNVYVRPVCASPSNCVVPRISGPIENGMCEHKKAIRTGNCLSCWISRHADRVHRTLEECREKVSKLKDIGGGPARSTMWSTGKHSEIFYRSRKQIARAGKQLTRLNRTVCALTYQCQPDYVSSDSGASDSGGTETDRDDDLRRVTEAFDYISLVPGDDLHAKICSLEIMVTDVKSIVSNSRRKS